MLMLNFVLTMPVADNEDRGVFSGYLDGLGNYKREKCDGICGQGGVDFSNMKFQNANITHVMSHGLREVNGIGL